MSNDRAMDSLHRVSKRATAWTRVNIAEGIPGLVPPDAWLEFVMDLIELHPK